MIATHRLVTLTALMILAACTTTTPAGPSTPEMRHDPQQDLGLLWVKHAAEYRAVSRQIYRSARDALPHYVDDKSWSAVPEQTGAEDLPPAVILDVDETVVSNVDFQLAFERPFTNQKLDDWSSGYESLAVPGVGEFVNAARMRGVTVFFLTNRPCERVDGVDDPCPQKKTTVDDIREIGIDVDPDFVMLANERPGWTREKLVRRRLIARDYRVIMLIGDDISDFIPCTRNKVVEPCEVPGTRASRAAALETYDAYWGAGWYILPNPMHGSWTSVR